MSGFQHCCNLTVFVAIAPNPPFLEKERSWACCGKVLKSWRFSVARNCNVMVFWVASNTAVTYPSLLLSRQIHLSLKRKGAELAVNTLKCCRFSVVLILIIGIVSNPQSLKRKGAWRAVERCWKADAFQLFGNNYKVFKTYWFHEAKSSSPWQGDDDWAALLLDQEWFAGWWNSSRNLLPAHHHNQSLWLLRVIIFQLVTSINVS